MTFFNSQLLIAFLSCFFSIINGVNNFNIPGAESSIRVISKMILDCTEKLIFPSFNYFIIKMGRIVTDRSQTKRV